MDNFSIQKKTYEYEYPRPALSVDVVVLRPGTSAKEVLLIERKFDPHQGAWALPGGFLDEDETLEQAADRELQEETGLQIGGLQQVKAYSQPDRDPRTRVISVAFVGEAGADATAIAGDDAANARWFPVDQLPTLAFDHSRIVSDALARFA